jgi:short-subunit dehydrogenase
MPTERAARTMVNGILRGRREVVVTFHAKVIIFLARHFPRLLRVAMLKGVRARPEPKR